MDPGTVALLIPIVGIVCGTGMVAAIAISIAIGVSRSGGKKHIQQQEALLVKLQSLETRVVAHEQDIEKLQEENRFLNRLLTENPADR
jgi:hypothetical protein